jgi:hypothetical protein
MPELATLSAPGFCLASAIKSRTDFTGTDGCTTSTLGELTASVMGAKSRTGSKGTWSRMKGASQMTKPTSMSV